MNWHKAMYLGFDSIFVEAQQRCTRPAKTSQCKEFVHE
jgi:hypothetical protein